MRCFNAGIISAINSVGGVCGGVGYNMDSSITDCYNVNSVSGGDCVAGICAWCGILVGYKIDISNCYNTGIISNAGRPGSIIGWVDTTTSTLKNCFWTSDKSLYYSGGKTPVVTNCSKKVPTVSDLGSNWKADTKNINGGYPILSWQN